MPASKAGEEGGPAGKEPWEAEGAEVPAVKRGAAPYAEWWDGGCPGGTLVVEWLGDSDEC
jgi:hypothetical protein